MQLLNIDFAGFELLGKRRWKAAGILALILCVNCCHAQDLHLNLQYQQIAKALSELLPAWHVTAKPLDDEISTRAFDRFIRELDPSQSIFQPSDLADFERFRTRLDDELREGSLRFPDLVFRRLQERRSKAGSDETGRKLEEGEQLVLFLNCVTQAYDPHTLYRAPETQANFQIATQLSLQGIGALLSQEMGDVFVTSLVSGGAAALDGRLRAGDKIVSIQQRASGPVVGVHGMKLEQVVSLIRGEVGSRVRLSIERDGASQDIELVRAKIQLQEGAAYGEVLKRSKESNGKTYRIGFIGLPSFYLQQPDGQQEKQALRSATRDVLRLLEQFASESVDAVVLDLSSNDRGSLSEAVSCAGLFIDQGPVIQLQNSRGELQTLADEQAGTSWDGPLVVVTSKESVSASEVFAGTMRCYERALIIGDSTTHGKGTIQNILELGDYVSGAKDKEAYGALKITTKQFYFPDGTSNQKTGVRPDVLLPNLVPRKPQSEADFEFALPSDSVPAIPFRMHARVNEAMRGELQRRSSSRLEQLSHNTRSQQPSSSAQKQTSRFESNFFSEEVLRIAMDYSDL